MPPAVSVPLSRVTKVVLCVSIVALIVWATVAAIWGADGCTISEHVRYYAAQYPVVPFALGVLVGHWLWPMGAAQKAVGGA